MLCFTSLVSNCTLINKMTSLFYVNLRSKFCSGSIKFLTPPLVESREADAHELIPNSHATIHLHYFIGENLHNYLFWVKICIFCKLDSPLVHLVGLKLEKC